MLVIDGIANVTLSNGMVRLGVVTVGADGERHSNEEIAIPATQYGNVVQALHNAGQNLKEQLDKQSADTESEEPAQH